MNLVVIFGTFIATTFSSGYAENTFSPEETLFTYTRCMEDHFKDDYELVKKWMAWELPTNDEKSPCFAKCVLIGLELFDEGSSTFKSDNILAQYNEYKSYTEQDKEKVKQFADAVKSLGTIKDSNCLTVFDKYLPLHEKFKDVQRNVYFGEEEITDKIYAANSTIKKRNETMFRFCERIYFPKGGSDLCKLRRTGITSKNQHLDCLFRGLRYFDRNGNINSSEIKRDLRMIGVYKDDEVDQAIKGCQVDDSKKATNYNDCLWKNPTLEPHMMDAFDYREVRSESYRYMLTEPRTYNREAVKAKVQQYDNDAGCNS